MSLAIQYFSIIYQGNISWLPLTNSKEARGGARKKEGKKMGYDICAFSCCFGVLDSTLPRPCYCLSSWNNPEALKPCNKSLRANWYPHLPPQSPSTTFHLLLSPRGGPRNLEFPSAEVKETLVLNTQICLLRVDVTFLQK